MNPGRSVYAAEADFATGARARGDPAVRHLDWIECENLAHHAAFREGLTARLRLERLSPTEAAVYGTADASFEDGVGVIRLSDEGQNPVTVLHEVAHLLVPEQLLHRAHNRLWVARYVRLVAEMLGRRTAGKLAVCLHRHGVEGLWRGILLDGGVELAV